MVRQRGREGAALELGEWDRECRRQSCPQDMDVSHLGCSPRWLQAKEAGNELALTSSLSFHSSANLHPPGQKNRNEKNKDQVAQCRLDCSVPLQTENKSLTQL